MIKSSVSYHAIFILRKGRSVFAAIRDKLGQNCLSVSFICFELLSGRCCGYGWPNQNFDLEPCFGWRCTGLCFFNGIICGCFLYLFSSFFYFWFLFLCCGFAVALFLCAHNRPFHILMFLTPCSPLRYSPFLQCILGTKRIWTQIPMKR